jgi:hypothetical protein
MVLQQASRDFPDPAAAKRAIELLDQYGREPYQPSVNVTHLAILLLSFGDLSRLQQLVEEAKRDYRDVLFRAQCLKGFSALLSY